jgi:negative regulator of flagellin synthesis FlgM
MSNSIDSVVDSAIHRLSNRSNPERGNANSGKMDTAPADRASDLIDFTGRAKELQTLQQDLANSPEFDAARVNELKEAIASGEYKVNAESITDKLLAIELKLS